MASPPKPWERNGAASSAAAPAPAAASSSAATPSADSNTTTTSGSTPAIPARPASLTASVNQNAANYSRPMGAMGASPYGVGSYGTTYGSSYGSAYSSPYSSPYSRYGGMGGYGSSMYGGYGGSMYGGGMYGGGMYGGGMGGMPGDPNNPESLTNRFNMSTMATFQMLEGIVGAFGGFAQMLESTYMATHSSFFAMVAVAEQFGNLRQTLGSILGIFTIMRWIRTVFAKITGKPLPADATSLTPASFAMFEGRGKGGAAGAAGGAAGAMPKPSRKPLIFFVLAAFGLPYVMSRVIKSLASNAEEEEKKRQMVVAQQQTIDPTKLEFCRVLYDFSPAAQGNVDIVPGVDLEVHKGDLVAILSKSDPLGQPSEWWKCRARDGRIGYLPQTFLEVLKKPGQPVAAIAGAPSISIDGDTRANSLSSILSDSTKKELVPALPAAKASDISVESFQKSQFFS